MTAYGQNYFVFISRVKMRAYIYHQRSTAHYSYMTAPENCRCYDRASFGGDPKGKRWVAHDRSTAFGDPIQQVQETSTFETLTK